MTAKTQSILKNISIIVNLGFIIAYIIVCLVPFINTGENWYLAFPGLVFPILFFGLFFFIILWGILKSKWFWVSIAVMLSGIQQITSVFSFHLPEKFTVEKKANTLRVLQWNVTSWDEGNKKAFGGTSYRPLMLDLVKKKEADILCFEEFFEPKDSGYFDPNISAFVKMGYPFYYFVRLSISKDEHQSGIAIFSKYPIIDSAKFDFKRDYTGEHIIYTDIKVKNKIFRVFATHLRPVYFDESEYKISNWMNTATESDYGYTRSLFSRIKRGYEFRYKQAELVSEKINESPYPSILCGDFNDVPNSSTYFNIKGDLQDAFLKKGSGFGATIPFISPTLRIDYIFASQLFKVTQFNEEDVPYSNHYPLVTDLQY